MKKRPLLEVCIDNPVGLLAAVDAGADRIELCSALALSGLTPSSGMMGLARDLGVPTHAMIRPRSGDFRYDVGEIDVMRRDIDAARAAGLAGVVFGANLPSGALDEAVLDQLLNHARGLSVTLHRAFDLVPDLADALQSAITLGFDRVLTSGGAVSATLGAERIAALVHQAHGRIVIMAGAGVDSQTVTALIKRTGVSEVHASCRAPVEHFSDSAAQKKQASHLGFVTGDMWDTDGAQVAQLVKAIATLSP